MQDVGVVRHDSTVHCDDPSDIEKQSAEISNHDLATERVDQTVLTIVVPASESINSQAPTLTTDPVGNISTIEKIAIVESPKKPCLSRNHSFHEQCRVCQEEKEEELIDLGCHCRGGLAKAHRTCIDTWFSTRGSNKCEICQQVAVNVASPEAHAPTSYWIWRVDPSFRGTDISQERDRVRSITLSQAPALMSMSCVLLLKSVSLYRVVLIHFGLHFVSSLVVCFWMC
uniref:Ubiquitin-protein ligase n=1 Tax=Solanum tuberosum TaxID=4113 RepID=M1A506_SOLTU